MDRIVCVIVLIIVASAAVYSQEGLDKTATSACSYFELYRKDGWTIPGVHGAKVKSKRMAFTNIPGVYVTMLEPSKSESTMTDIWCSREHNGRIEIEDRPIRILDLWAFDFGGRPFAYGLSYGVDVVENGKRMPIGASTSLIFYDLDGSGRFTLSRGARFPFTPDMVPDWVKDRPKGSAKQAQSTVSPRD